MPDKVGRNDPCPCGSGKKYKQCCMHSSEQGEPQPRPSPRFRFEPGSYGGSGSFVPSLACLEQTTLDEWEYYYILVDPSKVYNKEETAVSQATEDLEAAFVQKQQSGSDYSVGEYLSDRGYISVADFKIVEE